ncbi:MAG: pilus assembly protein PilM [Candidatus Margulisiibacteriota bacterium]
MNRKLGIHIAPGAIKLVEVSILPKNVEVVSSFIDYFQIVDNYESQAKALLAALKKSKIKTRDANFVISAADIIYKLVEMPLLPDKELRSALSFKLKSLLPISFKDFILDYYRIQTPAHDGKMLYFVAAVPKENMLAIDKLSKAAGLNLKVILAPSSALENTINLAGKPPSAIIYIGKYTSIIILVKSGQLVFAREVKLGGEDITQAMVGVVVIDQGRLEVDYAKAEEIKNKFGVPVDLEKFTAESGLPAIEILAMMRPALEKFSLEIANTFAFYKDEVGDVTEFKKIYLSGGVAKTHNLVDYFRQQLGVEIELLPVNVITSDKDSQANLHYLTLAIGAALATREDINLVPKNEVQFSFAPVLAPIKNFLDRWRGYIFFCIFYLVVLFAVFGWFYFQKIGCDSQVSLVKSQYQQKIDEINRKSQSILTFDLSKYNRQDRFPLIIWELEKIVPSDVSLANITYKNDDSSLMISGVVLKQGGKTSMPDLVKKLERSRYIDNLSLVYMQESEKYTSPAYNFELRCTLRNIASLEAEKK